MIFDYHNEIGSQYKKKNFLNSLFIWKTEKCINANLNNQKLNDDGNITQQYLRGKAKVEFGREMHTLDEKTLK